MRRLDGAVAQAGDAGCCFPMSLRAASSRYSRRFHRQRRYLIGIEQGLVLPPSLSRQRYILAKLLAGVKAFLEPIARPSKKRHRDETLVETPCSPMSSRISLRVRSGGSAIDRCRASATANRAVFPLPRRTPAPIPLDRRGRTDRKHPRRRTSRGSPPYRPQHTLT